MVQFVSNAKQPLKFFDELLDENGYKDFRLAFFLKWEYEQQEWGSDTIKINFDEDYILDYLIPEGNNKVELSDTLISRIKKESEKTQNLILEAIKMLDFYSKPKDIYINEQLEIIDSLLKKNVDFILEYPEVFTQLNEIRDFIIGLNDNGFQIIQPSQNIIVETNTRNLDEDEILVDRIFGYLKDAKELGVKIISESEYNRMVSLILEMIRNKANPIVEKEIAFQGQIKVGVLRYTFYVLQLSLFGKTKNEYFYQFMIDAFKHFKGTTPENLGIKISTIPDELPSYVSEIIRNQKQIQIERRG